MIQDLDPVKHPDFVFDPSNPNVAGRIVGIAMIAQPRKPLAKVENFYGSGVYALYYNGNFSAYRARLGKGASDLHRGQGGPRQRGQQDSRRTGRPPREPAAGSPRNIEKAEATLRLEDFEYRALVVQTGWQGAAEFLISLFKPIWNNEVGICYGFGKHGDDPATRANLRSPWDTLHPGRNWAHRDPNMKDARLAKKIIEDIAAHLSANPPLASTDAILRRFLKEMAAVS